MSKTKVVILSVPYTEPLPMVAPVLLSACLNDVGISAKGIDLGIEFFDAFINKPYWEILKNWLTLGVISQDALTKRILIDVLKFVRKRLKQIKKDHDPEYIGLSIFSNESIDFSYILIPAIRKYLPGTKIILGGKGLELICGVYNIKHYEKYNNAGMADVVVVGDAETAIIDVIQNNISGIHFAKTQTKEDLDSIPSPFWSDYDMSIYSKYLLFDLPKDPNHLDVEPRFIAITGSKGCVRKCTFCDVASYWPKYIYRDGVKIARDIIENYRATGINNFVFTDNLINGSITQFRSMNQTLVSEIPDTIKYGGYAIFRDKKNMPVEDFELAARAGCRRWFVGVESGSESVRTELRKDFSNADMDHSITNLHKNKIIQSWLLMVGYPTETEWDYLQTEELLRKYAHLAVDGLINLNITATFQLLHNSPLIQNEEFTRRYGLTYNINDNLSRYFWTADINPENTFDVRVTRWFRLVQLGKELGYTFQIEMPMDKIIAELTHLKKIYEDYKPKKVFSIRAG